jgi:hypothetical protein
MHFLNDLVFILKCVILCLRLAQHLSCLLARENEFRNGLEDFSKDINEIMRLADSEHPKSGGLAIKQSPESTSNICCLSVAEDLLSRVRRRERLMFASDFHHDFKNLQKL